MPSTKLLVVVDGSKASKRAVSYVAKMVGRRRGFEVCLAHPLSVIPPALQEFGSARSPDESMKLQAALQAEQEQWIVTAKEDAQPALSHARAELRKAGLAAGAVEEQFCYPSSGRARGDEILELARRRRCRTVVIGSESLSWLKQLMGNDAVEELLRRGKGFTIWVVE